MRFHCPTNPNFSLRRPGLLIQFSDGEYQTKDPRELRALERSPYVEELKRKPPRKKPATSTARALLGE